MAHFNRHLENIDIDFWHRLIADTGRLRRFERGETLCTAGEPTTTFGSVVSGHFIYHVERSDALETAICGFAFAGALVGDIPNCFRGQRANLTISASESTEAYVADSRMLSEILAGHPELMRHYTTLLESCYNSLLARTIAAYSLSAAERYAALVEAHPQILQDARVGEIASYLRVTPTHLSRIRRDYLKNKS